MNLTTGTVREASTNAKGRRANADSVHPDISNNGRFIVFLSRATNLDPDQSDSHPKAVFIKNMRTGTVELLSKNAQNEPADKLSQDLRISGEGSVVVFSTAATNLIPDADNEWVDVFAVHRRSSEVDLVSKNEDGIPGNGDSYAPDVTRDGEGVLIVSEASNLVTDDLDAEEDLFLASPRGSAISLINTGPVVVAEISGNGEIVVWQKEGVRSWVILDLVTTSRKVVSRDRSLLAMSGTGRYMIIGSYKRLTQRDIDHSFDLYVRDWESNTLRLAVLGADGKSPNGWQGDASLSTTGRWMTFKSDDSNLIDHDENGLVDGFVTRLR